MMMHMLFCLLRLHRIKNRTDQKEQKNKTKSAEQQKPGFPKEQVENVYLYINQY